MNVTPEEFGNALHLTVCTQKPNIVKMLLHKGADFMVNWPEMRYLRHTPKQIQIAIIDVRWSRLGLLGCKETCPYDYEHNS